MNQSDQGLTHRRTDSVERWPIGERRAAEKAEESETDVGSQDLSELGGVTMGLWRLGKSILFILAQGMWPAVWELPVSRCGERSSGSCIVGSALGKVRKPYY